MRCFFRSLRISFVFVMALAYCLWMSGSTVVAQGEWQVGRIVGLREGTCIRVGPSRDFPAHTRVPENDWAVKVIGGPRQSRDGRTWYDTSRREAGDPSGGTGWVDASQTDICPKNDPQPPAPVPAPPTSPGDWWRDIGRWWSELPDVIKWFMLVLLVAFVIGGTRSGALLKFVLLGVLSLLCYWFADQSRATWEPIWRNLLGRNAPDLALLFATLPFVIWVVARLRR